MLQFEIKLWRLAVKRYLKNDEPTYTEPPKDRYTRFAWTTILVLRATRFLVKLSRVALRTRMTNYKPFFGSTDDH